MIIDGKKRADALAETLKKRVLKLEQKHGFVPGLAVVLVGDNAASHVYVNNKIKRTESTAMRSITHKLAEIDQVDLQALILNLNKDENVDGILVQLPLPENIDPQVILETIDPNKDVDGFHPANAGRLMTGGLSLVPCTPQGCVDLIKTVEKDLTGKHAVVIGRSNIVGKPVAQLLLQENCTVTIIHSKTKNPAEICRQADIVVAAVGSPKLVTKDWVKPGAIVIDVGINRVDEKLVGDVDFDAVKNIARAITPVPGGVGPMTIAYLLQNTFNAACWRRDIDPEMIHP